MADSRSLSSHTKNFSTDPSGIVIVQRVPAANFPVYTIVTMSRWSFPEAVRNNRRGSPFFYEFVSVVSF